jgi:hypothetical protein
MKRSETKSGSQSYLDEVPLSIRGHSPAPKAAPRAESEGRRASAGWQFREESQEHFSPDPDAATDRYRLVTPFTLDI